MYAYDLCMSCKAWGVCKICENFEHARWMGSVAKEKAGEQLRHVGGSRT